MVVFRFFFSLPKVLLHAWLQTIAVVSDKRDVVFMLSFGFTYQLLLLLCIPSKNFFQHVQFACSQCCPAIFSLVMVIVLMCDW